jgi:diguanylate cyclase (GGDEF)-like protein
MSDQHMSNGAASGARHYVEERCSHDCEHDTQDGCISSLKHRVKFDSRTDLGRNHFMREIVTDRIARGYARDFFAYLVLDLDNFKRVNDTHGHIVGDEVLRLASEAIRSTIRIDRGDFAARRGGDEFAVLLSQPLEPEEAAERIRGYVFRAIARYGTGCSLGIAVWPDDGASWEKLDTVADERMRADKAKRKAGR